MSKRNGGPAFPSEHESSTFEHFDDSDYIQKLSVYYRSEGMSLRDWFAGMAMQGFLAHSGDINEHRAWAVADIMLAAREAEDDS